MSQICREALEEFVRKGERVWDQVAYYDKDQQVRRFAESDLVLSIEPDWVGMALEDANDWIQRITPDVWKQFCHQRDILKKNGRGDEIWHAEDPLGGDGRGFWQRREEHKEWFIHQYDYNINQNAFEQARAEYCHTWVSYVESVRLLVEQHKQEQRDEVMAELRQKWQALIEPKLPQHLLD